MNPLVLIGMGALKNLRGLKTVLIAGAAIFLVSLSLAIWAGLAAIGWLSNQVPVAKEALIAKAPDVRRQIEGVAPGIAQGVDKFLSGETAMSDVPGEDPRGMKDSCARATRCRTLPAQRSLKAGPPSDRWPTTTTRASRKRDGRIGCCSRPRTKSGTSIGRRPCAMSCT